MTTATTISAGLTNRPGPAAADTGPEVDLRPAADHVRRAIVSALESGAMRRRPIGRSGVTVDEPEPMAGLRAAQRVARIAERQAYKFAVELRGEGVRWDELADLLDVPLDGRGPRRERTFDLVAGPPPSSAFSTHAVHWYCRGPLGCGQFIRDSGPFNGHPVDEQHGHAEDCRRLAAEVDAYRQQQEEDERRYEVMEREYAKLTGFAKETADRARQVRADHGRYLGWSTSETLAVALVLDDQYGLDREGYSTKTAAIERVFNHDAAKVAKAQSWIRQVRAAVTGDA